MAGNLLQMEEHHLGKEWRVPLVTIFHNKRCDNITFILLRKTFQKKIIEYSFHSEFFVPVQCTL